MRVNPPPQNTQEWIRRTEQRLRSVENKSTARVGEWVLSEVDGHVVVTNSQGALVSLTNPDTGDTTVDTGRGAVFEIPDTIPAERLVGTAPPGLVDLVPTGAIGAGTHELLANPIFTADMFGGETQRDWTPDSTRWYGNNPQAGSVKVVANAFPHEMQSDPSRVTPGQIVPMSFQASWTGLIAWPTSIQLVATGYREDPAGTDDLIEVERVVVTSIPGLVAESEDHADAEVDERGVWWVPCSGEYTARVADATHPYAVTWVALSVYIAPSALAGSIWVSGAGMTRVDKPDVLPVAAVNQLPTTLNNQQNAQIAAMSIGYRNPKYICRYAIGDVSYPDFNNSLLETFGTTDGASTGTAHTHTLHLTNDVTTGPAQWDVPPGTALGGIVGITQSAVMDSYAMIGNKDAGTLNNVFLDLYRLNESSVGGMVQLASVNVTAQFSTTSVYVEADLAAPIVVNAGEDYMVVLRNNSTVATNVTMIAVLGITAQARTGAKWSGTDVGLAAYDAAQLAAGMAATGLHPWVQIAAKNTTETAQSWSDNFDRDRIGGQWLLKSSTGSQLDLFFHTLAYNGLADGHQDGIFYRPVSSDAQKVEGNLTLNLFALAGQRLHLAMHCARDFSQMVTIGVGSGTARIYSGPSTALVQRASVPMFGDGLYGLYYDAAADKYVGLKNNQPIGLEWTGVGGAVNHGRDYQFGGARSESLGFINGGLIDNFTIRDWTPM